MPTHHSAWCLKITTLRDILTGHPGSLEAKIHNPLPFMGILHALQHAEIQPAAAATHGRGTTAAGG